MATANLTGVLVDADASAVSDLVARLRARTTVADADAAHRADIVTAYYTARTDGDLAAELAALADATRYDTTYPGSESLVDELCADEQAVAA